MKESTSKRYYKISEVVDMTGVVASTLRFWETQFSILSPKRNDRGTRFYTPADIDTINMIKYLLHDKGLKIEAAREELRINRDGRGSQTARGGARPPADTHRLAPQITLTP